MFPFDSSLIESTALGSQSLTDVSITYFDFLGNPLQDINGNLVTNPLPNLFLTPSQTITIRVTNNTTNNSNGACFNETPRILCITLPISTINLNVNQENATEILDYEWTYQNGNILSTNTNLDVNLAKTYFVTLTKTDGINCFRTKEILVNNSEIAKITLDDIIIKDDADINTITLNTKNNNLRLGNYEFSLDDEFFDFQDDPFFNHVSSGFHTIYIRDKNGYLSLGFKVLTQQIVNFY